ncbi:MAG: hypothetical protein H6Q42_2388, partial [Deltaproteobacteria bacterium]|nr:hypothetical protein [Deltaproteobacteria bacterium]
ERVVAEAENRMEAVGKASKIS